LQALILTRPWPWLRGFLHHGINLLYPDQYDGAVDLFGISDKRAPS